MLACDMPDVPNAHLTALLRNNASCVITEDASGRLHPLCAVYGPSCLPIIRDAIEAGRLKLLDVVAQLAPSLVRYPGVLSNINTLEDLRSAG